MTAAPEKALLTRRLKGENTSLSPSRKLYLIYPKGTSRVGGNLIALLQAYTGGIVNWEVISGITGVTGKWWVAAPRNGMTDGKRGDHRTRSRTVGNSRASPRESSLLGLHSGPYEVVTAKNWWG
jgi:hypothetical protein